MMKKEESMVCYCIFCVTQKTSQILEELSSGNIIPGLTVLQPKIVQRKWIRKNATEEIHDYLPGYLFLYSETPLESFLPILRLDGVIRRLGSQEDDYQLQGSDLTFARALYRAEGIIGTAKAYKEGDRVKLAGGILSDADGQIIKLDRHRGRAQIEFRFDETTRRVWVGYDLIEDRPDDLIE